MNDAMKFMTLFVFVAIFTTVNLITEYQIQDMKTEIMVQGKLLQMDDKRLANLEMPTTNNTNTKTSDTDFLDKMNCNQVGGLLKDVGYSLNGITSHDDVVMKATKLQPYCEFGIKLPNSNASKIFDIVVTCSSIYQTGDDKWHYRNRNGTDFTAEQLLARGNCS